MRLLQTTIGGTWNGGAIPDGERVHLAAELDAASLTVVVDAPLRGDPAPDIPAGRCPGLWEHEVVELFLASGPEHYLEIELGPWGHYLVLELRGTRNVIRDDFEIEYEAECYEGRWCGRAAIDGALVPKPLRRWNAFAIHGPAGSRRYLATSPLPGEQPDFHQVAEFPRL